MRDSYNCDPVRCSSPQPNSGICPHSCHAFCSPVCLLLQRYSVTQCHSIHLIFAKQTFGQLLRNLLSRLLNLDGHDFTTQRQLSPLASVVYLRRHQDWYLVMEINLIGFGVDSFSCFCHRIALQSEQCSVFGMLFRLFIGVYVFPHFLEITIS